MTARSEPDLSTEQAARWRVRAAQWRLKPGVLRSAGSFPQPLGCRIEPGAVRGYYIDMRVWAKSLQWPPEWWPRHEEQHYIAVSQLGLGCYERFLAGDGQGWLSAARRTEDYLVGEQNNGGTCDGGWLHLWAYPHVRGAAALGLGDGPGGGGELVGAVVPGDGRRAVRRGSRCCD